MGTLIKQLALPSRVQPRGRAPRVLVGDERGERSAWRAPRADVPASGVTPSRTPMPRFLSRLARIQTWMHLSYSAFGISSDDNQCLNFGLAQLKHSHPQRWLRQSRIKCLMVILKGESTDTELTRSTHGCRGSFLAHLDIKPCRKQMNLITLIQIVTAGLPEPQRRHFTICRQTIPRVDQQYSGISVLRRQPFS
jgi:hypothetical protein